MFHIQTDLSSGVLRRGTILHKKGCFGPSYSILAQGLFSIWEVRSRSPWYGFRTWLTKQTRV